MSMYKWNRWIRGTVAAACAVAALDAGDASFAAEGAQDAWKPLAFLEGTWEAKTDSGAAQAQAAGSYSFVRELKGHVLARHSKSADCKGPKDFDCEHSDLLYVYEEMPGKPLRALYLDNEGHAIHYSVTAPSPGTAEFLSDPSPAAPQFRLFYQLKGPVMYGKFQMRPPGVTDWKSYLEWSGPKK